MPDAAPRQPQPKPARPANPFVEDLAEAVVRAIRRYEDRDLPWVQVVELGGAGQSGTVTLPAQARWILFLGAAGATPNLAVTLQGLPLPVPSFPWEMRLYVRGGNLTVTNNDTTNPVTILVSDRPLTKA